MMDILGPFWTHNRDCRLGPMGRFDHFHYERKGKVRCNFLPADRPLYLSQPLYPSPVPLLTASLGNLTACRIGQMECLSVLGT